MPKFVVETDPVSGVQLDLAMRMLRQRFPELVVETLSGTRRDDVEAVRWVCRAPGPGHIEGWAQVIGLTIVTLRRKDPGE